MGKREREEKTIDLYCAACKKTFDNENVFHHHKKGKKHIKAISKMTKEPQKEEEDTEFSNIQLDKLKKTALMETWILRLRTLMAETFDGT